MGGQVASEEPPSDALLSFVGQSLLSLECAVGDQSHDLTKLGYPSCVSDLSWQLSSSQKGGRGLHECGH